MTSRFFAASDSSSDESSEEELYSEEEESEEEKSEDESDEEDSDESDESGSAKGAERFLRDASSESESDEEDGAKVLKSAKDKRFEELEGTVRSIENAEKINDWAVIQDCKFKIRRNWECGVVGLRVLEDDANAGAQCSTS